MGKQFVTQSFTCGNCLHGWCVTIRGKQFVFCPVLHTYRNLSDKFIPNECIGHAVFSIQPVVDKLTQP
jgi:hypothetical protein